MAYNTITKDFEEKKKVKETYSEFGQLSKKKTKSTMSTQEEILDLQAEVLKYLTPTGTAFSTSVVSLRGFLIVLYGFLYGLAVNVTNQLLTATGFNGTSTCVFSMTRIWGFQEQFLTKLLNNTFVPDSGSLVEEVDICDE